MVHRGMMRSVLANPRLDDRNSRSILWHSRWILRHLRLILRRSHSILRHSHSILRHSHSILRHSHSIHFLCSILQHSDHLRCSGRSC